MRLWRDRSKRPLQTSLAFDFLRFFLIIVVIVLAAYLFIQIDVTRKIKDYMIADPDLKPEASLYSDNPYTGPETGKLLGSGGWLEVLNQDKTLIDVIGAKADTAQSYTEEQLYGLLENGPQQQYYYSLTRYEDQGTAAWLLLKIPRNRIEITINSYPFQSQLNQPVTFYILSGTIVMLLVVVGYSYSVARRIRKPLRTVSEGLNEMIQGNYSTRIMVDAEEEFIQIGERFNYMADVIETTTEARRQAEESKQRMIMDLSHDLKTPITSIQGYAQALYEGRVTDPERQRKYLTYIYNKSSQVTKLIQNMVELLKTDSPDFLLKLGRYDLGDFLREIIADTYGEIEQNSFTLHFKVPEHAIYARFDPELLSRAVHNLISNALTYNPAGTELRIELIPGNQRVAIEIADTGIGISPELRAVIFDPFVRGDEARTASGGTGLGLAIALKNTERMGGTLKLGSSPAETTVFTIEIPV
ncbi:sensor histidine kinase [Paenibacillus sp. PK3_47]|uniref:sensor histidine kinase n=1 Tax=Paenibacillus sp. PK3_47 TaxID=2072642 RepID=UPI00201DCAFF|nr:HAMP domain-containing sensor histidine kinase [Paenibacillus sp. PK3_47]UQZ36799.1 sensor histidine kinase [Paenibacillus sp. PK3_47]